MEIGIIQRIKGNDDTNHNYLMLSKTCNVYVRCFDRKWSRMCRELYWKEVILCVTNFLTHFLCCSAELPVLCPEMATEGTLWFTNLLVPDTTLILPISVCLLNLTLVEVGFQFCWLLINPACDHAYFLAVIYNLLIWCSHFWWSFLVSHCGIRRIVVAIHW